MLETLTKGFTSAREKLRGVRELTEENIEDALRDVRMSLLEADVEFQVTRSFLERVKERALGEKVETRVRDRTGRVQTVGPGQHFVAICEQELCSLMGPVDTELARGPGGVVSVLLVGLQGVGKTTVAAKLARYFQANKRRPLLVAADIHRPAAILQLEQLGASLGVPVHKGPDGEHPASICAGAAERARKEGFNAIVYDTAGRLAVDDELMDELAAVVEATSPANTLLVCDALMGRDAVNVASAFGERIHLDGLVMTKIDGDARGGAALSVKAVTGVPIKFLGTGETLDRLEAFRPEGLASRILGMGDVVGLVQDFESVLDEKEAAKAEEDAERMLQGRFTMEDLLTQLRTIQKMGPLREVFAKLPMMGSMADQVDEKAMVRIQSMIHSMTLDERKKPSLIDKSRAQRIADGSGRRSKDVHDLVARFRQMREMMASLGSRGGLLSKIPGMGRLAGAGVGDLGAMGPGGLLGGPPGGGGSGARSSSRKRVQQKKKRKQARQARKRSRKR